VTAHIANHPVSLVGVPAHIHFMELGRKIFRQPAVESLLLLCVAFQVGAVKCSNTGTKAT
jgi:hypothetical protein